MVPIATVVKEVLVHSSGAQSILIDSLAKSRQGSYGYPLIFPMGRSSATFFVMPAKSTVSTTSEIFL
jgi:hypothetical protein